MAFDFNYVISALKIAVTCIPVTLILSIVPFVVGIFFGTLIAITRKFNMKYIGNFFKILISVLKGIPLVLYVLALNFIILKPLDLLAERFEWANTLRYMDKIYIGIVAMSIFAIVLISETIRSALYSVPNGQYEACYSVGLTKSQALKKVILPQAYPVAIPVLCNNFIALIKGSSVVYLITVVDVMNGALSSAQINYRFLEAYIAAALVYWILCIIVENISSVLENKLTTYKNKIAI